MTALIREHRAFTESERRLAPAIVDRLIETRLCRAALPEALGGLGLAPIETLEVYETLARAEASVPWIVWNNSLVCFFSRFLDEKMRREIFADVGWLYAQSTRPSGRAVAEGGGYRVRGRWALVSGCELAEWLFLLCAVGDDESRFIFFRRGDYEILDTWDVSGLRGTGSHDVVVDDLFVPADRAVSISSGASTRHALERLPIVCTISAGFAAQTLGIASACIDSIVETARVRTTPGPAPDLRDRPEVQAGVARHRSALDAAREHLHRVSGASWGHAKAGKATSMKEIGAIYGAALHAVDVAREAVFAMSAFGGTSALYTASPLERPHRDLHAMLRHIVAQPLWLEDAGRGLFGLPAQNPLYAV